MSYSDFLAAKAKNAARPTVIAHDTMRACHSIWADTGLGKTRMQGGVR